MGKLQNQADAVRNALTSTATCSSATASILRELLNGQTASKENIRPKFEEKTGRATVPRSAPRAKASAEHGPKAKSNAKSGTLVNVQEEDLGLPLSAREKYVLAQETVNISLKSLTETLKPQAQSPRVFSKEQDHGRKSFCGSPSRGSSLNENPLQSRQVNEVSNATSKSSTLRRSSSSNSFTQQGPSTGVLVVAECARLAFAYLRSTQANQPLGKGLPVLQLENGMLALVGKFVSLGLSTLAIKELCILKPRLEKFMRDESEEDGLSKKDKNGNNDLGSSKSRETLASLLLFSHISEKSPALSLVVSHQMLVLRLIAAAKRSSATEAIIEHLMPGSPCCPASLVLRITHLGQSKERAARQLQSLGQIYFSLCPSSSGSEDAAACNTKLHPSPRTAFVLQQLALETRIRWWTLVNHQANIDKELLEPFVKYLNAFMNRNSTNPRQIYDTALECSTRLRKLLRDWANVQRKGIGDQCSWASLESLLSTIAQSAGNLQQAVSHAETALASSQKAGPVIEQSTLSLRLATLALEDRTVSEPSDAKQQNANSERMIKTGLEIIKTNSLSHETSENSQILVSAMALRRAAVKFLMKNSRELALSPDSKDASIMELSHAIIFESLRFLTKFMKAIPKELTCTDPSSRRSRSQALATQVAKGTIDSVLGVLKTLVSANDIPWDELDSILQDCTTSISLIESWTKVEDIPLPKDFETGQYLIKVSNLYWVFQSHQSKIPNATALSGSIQALVRSVDLLRPRSKSEQETGLLAVKLERLSAALDSAGRSLEAHNALTDAINVLIRSGASQEAAKLLANNATHAVWASDGQLGQLGRLLMALAKRLKHENNVTHGFDGFFDDSTITPAERGSLLEQQLHLISTGLHPRRAIHTPVAEVLQTIVQHLFEIYTSSKFPIRRQRLCRNVLQLVTDFPTIWSDDLVSLAMEDNTTNEQQISGADSGLKRFQVHIQAGWMIGKSFYKGLPGFEALKPALLDWQSIIASSSTWDDLLERVDGIESLVAQLQAVANFLDMQGLETQRVAVLRLLSRIEELRKKSNPTSLAVSKTQLALQYLRLGYSGRAGTILSDSRSLLSSSSFPPEARLQFQIADAENLLTIGDKDSCRETLKKAALLAIETPEIQKLSGPSASSSERVRYIKSAADASNVLSILALESGHTSEALAQAKRTVRLYQRAWAILENRHLVKPNLSLPGPVDSEVETLAEEVAKVGLDSAPQPLITSMTHEGLRGPVFWPLVSSLVRTLLHLARVYSHMGFFQESIYYSEQTEKIASAVQADALLANVRSRLSMYWIRSLRVREARQLLEKASDVLDDSSKTQEIVLYQQAMAHFENLRGNEEAELAYLERAVSALEVLTSSRCIERLDQLQSSESGLEETLEKVHLNDNEKQKKSSKSSRARKPQTKSVAKSTRGANISQPRDEDQSNMQFSHLAGSLATLLTRRAIVLLLQGSLTEAYEVLLKAQTMLTDREDTILYHMANSKNFLTQATLLLASDFTFNALPESTIAFPATVRPDKDVSNVSSAPGAHISLSEKCQIRSLSPRKGGRKAAPGKADLILLLQQANEWILEVHEKAFKISSTSIIHNLCTTLGQITAFLSATSSNCCSTSLQPSAVARSMESPRSHAFQSEINATAIDKSQSKYKSLLAWPSIKTPAEAPTLPSPAQFQRDYIDLIPESWTAISISLSETGEDFYVARYHAHESPFILRLPTSRQKADDMDDDEPFTFEQGKKELLDIIFHSNNSAHDTRDMSVKGAKSAWWAEREALDARLRDLLLNIENIWLGGFRGIFSQHQRHSHLLARFQKSFQNILDRHLPSRQSSSRRRGNVKGKNSSSSQHVTLDPRVLELFIGLGNATDDSLDIDEALMDLVYFVVDILQFSGERNAYDEIDFDAIVVETIDALKAYHEAASHEAADGAPRHTILILDKRLHAFPWESLPCLDGLAVSRVPSMKALRDRILIQRRQSHQQCQNQHQSATDIDHHQERGFHLDRSHTSYVLNPSGDLSHTEKVLSAPLKTLPPNPASAVPCLTGRAPSEQDFESLLTHSDILLYFGHGSGAQYIRTRTVKRLSRCAPVVWLMGCSSGAVTENGEFEPHGSVLGYLAAGWSSEDGALRDMDQEVRGDGQADMGEVEEQEDTSPCMAVCATLWDVTDKDIDRFSVRLGEEWGLWPGGSGTERATASAGEKISKTPKTPRRKGKGRADVKANVESDVRARNGQRQKGRSLVESVARSRGECYLRYLNGAAPVVYGVPVWLD